MLTALLPSCARVICTTAPSPRALDAEALAALASEIAAAARPDASLPPSPIRRRRGRCLPRWRACRRRRIDLSHRSPAWYSSLIFRVLRRASVPADAPPAQPFACIAASISPSFSPSSACPASEVSRPQARRRHRARSRLPHVLDVRRHAGRADEGGRRTHRARPRADRLRCDSRSGGLRRHAVLRRLRRDLPDSNRIVATGNVKVGTPSSFITAERVEFDTKARTGTFYKATGWRRSVTASTRACSARRSPTRCFGAARSTSSGRRNTRSSTVRSPPACSRRRAGRSCRARPRSTSTTTRSSRTRSSGSRACR